MIRSHHPPPPPPPHHRRNKSSLSQSSFGELHLSPSSISAANSSITGGTSSISASASIDSHCRAHRSGMNNPHGNVENNDDGELSVDSAKFQLSPVQSSIPHLLSTASDEEDENDPYHNRHAVDQEDNTGTGGRRNCYDDEKDQFETMLLNQQRESDAAGLNDTMDSLLVYAGDNDSSFAAYPFSKSDGNCFPTQTLMRPSSSSDYHSDDERSTGTGKSTPRKHLLSKFSSSSDCGSAIKNQPFMMIAVADLDDDDVELPSMLSPTDMGKLIASAETTIPSSSVVVPLASRSCDKESPPTTTALPPSSPCHRRGASSVSSSSSQSSFRSILRNGNGNVNGNSIGTTNMKPNVDSSSRTPLKATKRTSKNRCPVQESNENLSIASKRSVSHEKNPKGSSTEQGRGRSVEKRDGKDRRSVSYSASIRKSSSYSLDRTYPASERKDRTKRSQHRRSVSWGSELVKEETKSRPSGSYQHGLDPNLTSLLDMASGRQRRRVPPHVTEISPKTAVFLASDSPAVAKMCEEQEVEKYGLSRLSHSLSGVPDLTRTERSQGSAASLGSRTVSHSYPAFALSASNTYPPTGASTATTAALCRQAHIEEPRITRSFEDISSPARDQKRHLFSFSSSDRKKGKPRRKRSPVGFLSPVEEGSMCEIGSPPLCVPTATDTDASYDIPACLSNESTLASNGEDNDQREISPVSKELQKAAKYIWTSAASRRSRSTTSSSPSSTSTSSSTSRSQQPIPDVQCHCVIS